jgi:hypothetical protein
LCHELDAQAPKEYLELLAFDLGQVTKRRVDLSFGRNAVV